MDRVKKIYHRGKEIIVIDYTESKPTKMIEIFLKAKHLIEIENKHVLVLSIFSKNYVTPIYMRHVEKGLKEVENLIDQNVVIGLTKIQKMILIGVNQWYKKQIHSFESFDEGLEFILLSDKIDQSK